MADQRRRRPTGEERRQMMSQMALTIVSNLSAEEVLQQIIDSARELAGAQYAALGRADQGGHIYQFFTSGISQAQRVALGPLPSGQGILGALIRERRSIRLRDIAQDPRSVGFPSHHPPMKSFLGVPIVSKGEVVGNLYLTNKQGAEEFSEEDQELVEGLAAFAAVAIENSRLYFQSLQAKETLEAAYAQLEERTQVIEEQQRQLGAAYMGIARTLILSLETRDYYTRGHSDRVSLLSRMLASRLGLGREEVDRIALAATLHDIGKIGTSDSILLKPGSLTLAEWLEIQRHPARGTEMLRYLGFLQDTLPLIEAHHERYDGQGYPAGLAGEAIPLGARIIAVADGYEAMTSARPYRPPRPHQEAIQILSEGAGTQWSPEVVRALLELANPT